jgi:asparagine synthase (glutamine-hydrolysing)
VCGIAGWAGSLDPGPGTIDEILESLRHRGPDGRDVKHFPEATILHARLSIIDLSEAGEQPMGNEDESVWSIVNGELYNHRALQAELEANGHSFRGYCDAEVVPHLYEEHGDGLLERLRGMFALAVLDRRRGRLLLARDRFGIKPLFYARGDGFVAFASEIAALRCLPGLDLEVDRQALADLATMLYIPAPLTIHRGIRALVPGEVLEVSLADGRVVDTATRRYHSFAVAPDTDLTLERAVDRSDELVSQAVARQLESDVPLGSMLSGGIDSSLVSTFAQRSSPGELLTFNVRFPDAAYDETPAARVVADAIGSKHTTLDMDGAGGTWESVTSLLRHVGQPFADTSIFAVDAISRAMRRHVTVALSGDGGDEGFGGYNVYWRLERAAKLGRVPAPAWALASQLAKPLARAGVVRPTLPRSLRHLGADNTTVVQGLYAWLSERERDELLGGSDGVEPARRLFEPQWSHDLPPGASRLERLSAHAVEVNIRLVLANAFLPKVDSASMRNSLEARVPMLDEDLIAFGLTLPHRLRVDGRRGKRVLRRLAARHLPPEISERPKQGFAVPVDRWVDDPCKRAIRECLLDRGTRVADVFERRVYEPWVDAFAAGRTHHALSRGDLYQRVVMLLALELSLTDVATARRAAA